MKFNLVTSGALVVTGAGVTTSLLTSQQGSGKLTPKWYDKVKGENGFLYHTGAGREDAGERTLERLKESVKGKQGITVLTRPKIEDLEGCFNGKSQRKECEEVFVGWFYETRIEGNGDEKDCETKIYDDRSRVCGIAFVADQNLGRVRAGIEQQLGFKVYENCGETNKDIGTESNKCRFLGGTREQFINLWPKIIYVLFLFTIFKQLVDLLEQKRLYL